MRIRSLIVAVLTTASLCFATIGNAKDKHKPVWFAAGSHPQQYQMAIDSNVSHSGDSSGIVQSWVEKASGFGTYMQAISTEQYNGKRIKLSAYLKVEQVQGWAGMWARVDSEGGVVAFDNMQNRVLKGSQDWVQRSIVLDVPEDSLRLSFGLLLSGTGQSWIDDIELSVVDETTPVTGVDLEVNNEYYNIIGFGTELTSMQPNNMDFTNSAFSQGDSWWVSQYVSDKYKVSKVQDSEQKQLAYIGSDSVAADDLGVFLQKVKADKYAGKKLKVSGVVKSKDIQNWAGLWLRADAGEKSLSFENMQNNPIKGDSDWHTVSFKVDIPKKAEAITFGVVMQGNGHLWLDSMTIEVIGEAVDKIVKAVKKSTGKKVMKKLPTKAARLDFEI